MTQNGDQKSPIKYVLYTHYAKSELTDFQTWLDSSETQPLSELDGIKFLFARLRSLRDLLTSPGHEGLIVLFYARGLPQCFDGIAAGKSKPDLVKEHPELRFAEAVSQCVDMELAKNKELPLRIRFVTALDLYDIFVRAKNSPLAGNLRWWFIGTASDANAIRYDVPKIPEAIVRLRLLGNGIPVFRVDWDVLFSYELETGADLILFKAIATCLQRTG